MSIPKIQLPDFRRMCSQPLEVCLEHAKQKYNFDFSIDSPVSVDENLDYKWETVQQAGFINPDVQIQKCKKPSPQKNKRYLSTINLDTDLFMKPCNYFSDGDFEEVESPSVPVFEKAKDQQPVSEYAENTSDRNTMCDSNGDISFSTDQSRYSKLGNRSSAQGSIVFNSSFGRGSNGRRFEDNTRLLTVVEEDSTFAPASDVQILDEVSPRRPSAIQQNNATSQLLTEELIAQMSSGHKKNIELKNRAQIQKENSAQKDDDPFDMNESSSHFTLKEELPFRESIVAEADFEEGSTLQSTRQLHDTFFTRKESH